MFDSSLRSPYILANVNRAEYSHFAVYANILYLKET
jgi:hypothetical protein